MTQSLKTVSLDDRGLEYVVDQLTGVNILCSALTEVISSKRGQVFAIVPVDTSSERAHVFEAGGLLSENRDVSRAFSVEGGTMMEVRTLREVYALHLLGLLHGTKGSVCLIDDVLPRWNEPRDFDLGPAAFGIGEEVYHCIDADYGAEPLAKLLRRADALWHGVATICDGPRAKVPDEAWLKRTAATATQVSCTAYDGEGFVWWQRA